MAKHERPVTKADIEAKLREIKGDVDEDVAEAKPIVEMVAIGGVILLILLAYLLGRRKGKKKTTVVEIRRV
jgi:Lamp2-like protein